MENEFGAELDENLLKSFSKEVALFGLLPEKDEKELFEAIHRHKKLMMDIISRHPDSLSEVQKRIRREESDRKGRGPRIKMELSRILMEKNWRKLVIGEMARMGYDKDAASLESAGKKIDSLVNKLVCHNIRLVTASFKVYAGRGIPYLDLVQEGNLGLIKAVHRFDPARGVKFSTYAVWWIRHYMGKACATQGRLVRIPSHIVDSMPIFHRAYNSLQERMGRKPTHRELMEETGFDEERISSCINMPLASIHEMTEISDDTLSEHMMDGGNALHAESPDWIRERDIRNLASDILFTLPPIYAFSIRFHYGNFSGMIFTPIPIWKVLQFIRSSPRLQYAEKFHGVK